MNICSFLLLSERPTCIRYVHSQHDYGGDTYPFRKTADQVPRKSIAVLVWRKFVHAGAQTFGTPQEAGWSSSTAQLQYVPRDEADAVVTSNHVQVERAIGQSINQSIRTELPSSAASSTSAATARGIWLRWTPSWTSGLATVGMLYNQAGLVGSYSRSGVGS